MKITAADVKLLREKTGAGVMECKKALEKNAGDFTGAEAELKERGRAIAEQREKRITNQGRIFGRFDNETASLLELRCETDFVGENAQFIQLGERCVREAHDRRLDEPNDRMRELIVEAIALLRENIVVNSLHTFVAAPSDCIAGYVHDGGRTASLVRLSLSRPEVRSQVQIRSLAFDLALHVVAFAPQFIREEEIDAEYRNAVEGEFRRELAGSGKPEQLHRQIIDGKWRKHLQRVCLTHQPFLRNEELSVLEVVGEAERTLEVSIRISQAAYVTIAPAVCL